MNTMVYFEAFSRVALNIINHAVQEIGEDAHFLRRIRQAGKLKRRIAADLAADGWTYIVEGDPTTLPEPNIDVLAAWANGDKTRLVESECDSDDDETWYSVLHDINTLSGWRVYAWRPWPKAPVLRDDD